MRLSYNILWFEDSKRFFDSKKPFIEKYLDDLGFHPNIIRRPNDNDLIKTMNETDVDLILVDQNLSGKKKGDTLIESIRNNELYTEVVFYSQFSDYRLNIAGQLEGVFYSERKDLLEKTKKIINLTIKKNQDISNIRGLFIAEAIDISGQLEEIIIRILKIKAETMELFRNRIIQEEFFADIEKYRLVLGVLNEKIKILNLVTNGRYNEKQKQKASRTLARIKPLADALNRMEKEVIQVRNLLAHSKPSDINKRALECKKGPLVFDDAKCLEIRKTFTEHSNNLAEIQAKLRTILSINLPPECGP